MSTGRSLLFGYFAAFGISIAACFGMPLVNVFTELHPGELMMVRGAVTVVLILPIIAYRIQSAIRKNRDAVKIESRDPPKKAVPLGPLFLPTVWMVGFALIFSTATVPFYSAIREWGAGPSLVVLTATPTVNITAKLLWHKKSVAPRVFVCLLFLMLGVVIALNPFSATFNSLGLFYSVLATILVGIAFEVLGATKNVDPYSKSLWLGLITIGIGLVVTAATGRVPFAEAVWTPQHTALLAFFGFTGGFLYYVFNIIAFERLPTEVASILAMLETPVVLIGARVILGEQFGPVQAVGVAIALVATLAFVRAENKAIKPANDTLAPA